MRWLAPSAPSIGARRHLIRFAWLPVRLGDLWIWLERYTVTERYTRVGDGLGWVIDRVGLLHPMLTEEPTDGDDRIH